MRIAARERGDTIVEVLFAVAVFAMVSVGCLSIMNQGVATSQRSLEVTLVRQQIDAQAEAIRYIHQSYVANYHKDTAVTPGTTAAVWKEMFDMGGLTASPFAALDANGRCPATAPGTHPFILNAHKATVSTTAPDMYPPAAVSVPPYAQVRYDASSDIEQTYGLWIESVPSNPGNQTGYIDFHIRACWDSPGASIPVTLGTIVRLYDPR
jgi:type II secretory pathway pseudopilin PulG